MGARKLDGVLEVGRLDDRARRVVRVVEEEQVGSRGDLVRDRVEIRKEALRLLKRQVVELGAREERPRRVRRVTWIRREGDVAGVEKCERDVPDGLLAAECRHDLRARIELDAEAVAV